MKEIISKERIQELKKTIIKRNYPVKVKRNVITNDDTIIPYEFINGITIKDNFIICDIFTGATVRIDNKGIVYFSYEWKRNFADGIEAGLKEVGLWDKFVNICNERGVETVADEVIRLMDEDKKGKGDLCYV